MANIIMEKTTQNWVSDNFSDYQLLDSGDGKKLERIAGIIVERPSPQSIWRPRLPQSEWSKASSVCIRKNDGGGYWKHLKGEPGDKEVVWRDLKFLIRFTSFGHCGLFFEQTRIWECLMEMVSIQAKAMERKPKVINLFGYTGAASIAMAASGAEVFHVDSAKGVLTWGKQNAQKNKLDDQSIRWVQEDVLNFLRHSKKKGFKYDGILADPPSWGHGANKETWLFEKDFQALVDLCYEVLNPDKSFLLVTSHTHGVQQEAMVNVMNTSKYFPHSAIYSGELGISHAGKSYGNQKSDKQTDDRILPAGIYCLSHNL